MSLFSRLRFFALCAIAVAGLVGCEREEQTEAPPEPTPKPGWLVGSHGGEFPCVDCPGIETRLWLREDGAFFYRQNYLAADESSSSTAFYAMGHWRWDAIAGAVALEGDGPTRWFEPVGEGRLRFRTNAQPEHVLDRDTDERPFD